MPGDTEHVQYSYTGDVSSLKKATSEALSLLSKFETAMTSMASKDSFGASKTSVSSFQKELNGVMKHVNSLTTSLNDSGKSLGSIVPNATKTVASASRDLADVLDYLGSSTKITSDDMKFLSEVLKSSKGDLGDLAARAQLLTGSLTPLKSLNADEKIKDIGTAATQTQKQMEQTVFQGFKVQEAYSETGKSAAESAAVIEKAYKFSSMLQNVQNISNGIRSAFTSAGSTISGIWKGVAGHFDPIVTKLQTFKAKASESMGYVRQLADTVSSAFRRVQQSEDGANNAAGQSAKSHDLLEKELKDIQKAAGSEIDSLSKETSTLKTQDSQVKKSTAGHQSFSSVLNQVTSVIKSEMTHLNKLTSGFKKLAPSVTNISKLFKSLKGFITGSGLAEAAKQSINYAENLNLFNVAMGESVDQGKEFVAQMQELYGMDPSNLMRYAGNFYQLADAISMPDEASANLALGLTKATNDIASLFNIDVETVFENLSSGMQGMSRAVRKYGMDIRTVTLEQTALSLGIKGSVESMSEADRQGLRFITMMQQAANASGDFAKTIESPANQLRIFKEQMSQLGRSIGNLFIVPLSKAIQYINGFVMALRTAITFVGSLMGVTEDLFETGSSMGDTADGVESIGSAASGAAKEMKKLLAPFDELNVMQPKSSDSGSEPAGGDSEVLNPAIQDAISNMSWGLEDVKMKANEVRDALLNFLGFKIDAGQIIAWDSATFEANLIEKFPEWSQTIQATFDNWSSIVNGFKSVMKSLGKVAQAVWGKVSSFVGKFVNDDTASSTIENLGGSLESLASTISDHADEIATFLIALPVALQGIKIVSGIASTIGTLATAFTNISTAIGPLLSTLGSVVLWVGLIIGAIALLYTNSESFKESFNSLMTSLWEGLQPILDNIVSLFSTIWESLQKLWDESVQPMLENTGDALAPVLDTISVLWGNCSEIIADFVKILEDAWTEIIEPIFTAICDIINDVMDVFQTLWEEFLGPIIEEIGAGIQRLWKNHLKPIIDKVIKIVSDIIDIIMVLWNKVLAPIVDFLVTVLAPIFKGVFDIIWGAIEFVMGLIFGIFNDLMGVLSGVVEFIAGIFTGDWKKALSGLLNIFVALGNGIIGVLEDALNFCISLINGFLDLVIGGFKGLINGLGDLIEGIASFLGFDIDLGVNWDVPQIPKVSIPRIPEAALATGGVVTSPTYAMIGEGRYDEAVIPLGNSPQMQDLVNQIADAVNNNPGDGEPTPVQIFLDGQLFYETMVSRNRAATIRTGINPMLGG